MNALEVINFGTKELKQKKIVSFVSSFSIATVQQRSITIQ